MADLKLGTQIGGNLVWHQGILELNPVDDKLNYRDQEIMTTRGYQTMLGSIKFGTSNDVYDIESMNNTDAGAGTKRYLRKMRSGSSATIWHETILDNVYTISTGITDAAPQFTITNGNSATFQFPVLTNSSQSGAANSFARKDYVDAVDARNVAKAGDTMTGTLTVPKIVDNNTNIGKDILTYIKLSNVNQWAGPVGQSRFVTPESVGSPAGNKGGYWNVLSRRDSAGGYAGIFIPYGNSENKNYIGTQELGTNAPIWAEIYTNLNKPTPGDLNAYTKSEVDEKSWIRVKDERAAMIAPNALQSKTISAYFTNKSDVSTSWVSGFVVNGWESAFAAWSLFAGARSDTDEKRLWFKHGRASWLPSSRIYHEDDKPTNVELNLVSRAGDEMTGLLNMKVSDSIGYGKYSIKLNNGSIGGINQLVFGDPSDTQSEGIAWPKTGKNDTSTTNADYDMLWALDGALKFNGKETYGEWNKPSNNDLNLVSRSGDIIKGELEIQNAPLTLTNGMLYVNNGNTKRVIKHIGVQTDAKAMLILIAPKYVGKALPKRGFVGRVTFERGTTGSTLQANYVDISAVTAYKETDAQIHYESGGTPVKLVYHTHTDGIEYLALYRGVVSAATIYIDGYVYGEEPVVISDATGLTFTDLKTRARIYSSDNKPTNVDLNLVSRAGDTITGDLIATNIYSSVTQSTRGDSFARKDYVDTKVGTAVQSVTATGAVKSTGGINPVISLINATNKADGAMSAADKAKLDGLPSAAVNKTGDTMTGNLTFTNNSELVWSRNTDWAKIGFKNDSDADIDSYMWFETGDNKNEYFKFRMHNTTGPKHEVLDIKLEGSTFAHDVILKARESNAVKLTNATTEYTGNTGVERIIGGITSQWYDDNLVFGHIRTGGKPSAGFGVRLNDKYIMRVSPTGAVSADSFLITGAQSSDASASTRKDYVDTKVAKAGDTMTGTLAIRKDSASSMCLNLSNETNGWTWINFGASNASGAKSCHVAWNTTAYDGANANALHIRPAGDTAMSFGTTTVRSHKLLSAANNFTVIQTAPYMELHKPGAIAFSWNIPADNRLMLSQTNGNGVTHQDILGINANNNTIRINANPWSKTSSHGYASVYAQNAPLTVDFGAGPGTSDYYPIIKGSQVVTGQGYTTAATFGILRSGVNRWGDASITVGNGESAAGPIQYYLFGSDGTTTLPGKVVMKDHLSIQGVSPTILFQDQDHLSAFCHINSNLFYILRSSGANGTGWDGGPNGIHPMSLNLADGDVQFSRNGSFNDVQIRSDIRLKSNLIDIKGALDKVCSLTGKTFDKFGCDKREAGIIAQDLQKVLPEAVGSFKNTAGEEYLTVSNSGVNALLVEAIKELRAELNELKSKLNIN